MPWHLILAIGLVVAEPAAASAPADGPGSAPSLERKAETEYNVRDWKAAARLYDRLVAVNPTVGFYWYRLGEVQLGAKQYQKAIEALEKAEELGSFQQSPPRMVHRGDCAALLAKAHAAVGQSSEALRWANVALQQGLRDIRKLQSPEFAELLKDSDYRKLVWAVDTSGISRDEGYRLDLAFAVHELKRVHYAPFRATSEAEIDAKVAALDEEIPQLSDAQIFVRLMEIVALFGDGHTRVQTETARLPIRLFRFPEGLFVTGASSAHADLVGARVLRIGAKSADEALALAEPLSARENPMMPLWQAPAILQSAVVLRGLGLAPAEGPITLEVEDTSGKIRTVELDALTKPLPRSEWTTHAAGCDDPLPICQRHLDKVMWHEVLPDGETMYCQLNGIGHGEKSFQRYFDDLFQEFEQSKAQRLVVDLRFNGGGNTFLNPALVNGIIRCDKLREPGRLFVITGRSTFSAAINTTVDLERRTGAILVGEPPSSPPNFIGESVEVRFPYSGWAISISDLSWKTSLPMDYRVWISPTLFAPPTAAAFRAHRDPALEAIFDYVSRSQPSK